MGAGQVRYTTKQGWWQEGSYAVTNKRRRRVVRGVKVNDRRPLLRSGAKSVSERQSVRAQSRQSVQQASRQKSAEFFFKKTTEQLPATELFFILLAQQQ